MVLCILCVFCVFVSVLPRVCLVCVCPSCMRVFVQYVCACVCVRVCVRVSDACVDLLPSPGLKPREQMPTSSMTWKIALRMYGQISRCARTSNHEGSVSCAVSASSEFVTGELSEVASATVPASIIVRTSKSSDFKQFEEHWPDVGDSVSRLRQSRQL